MNLETFIVAGWPLPYLLARLLNIDKQEMGAIIVFSIMFWPLGIFFILYSKYWNLPKEDDNED